jgi:hypothetical protein
MRKGYLNNLTVFFLPFNSIFPLPQSFFSLGVSYNSGKAITEEVETVIALVKGRC